MDAAPARLGRLERLCEVVCGVGLWALVGIVIVGIVARDALHLSFSMSDEVGGYILVGLTFLAMPVCQASGAFHKVMFMHARLPPRGQAAMDVLFDLLSLACCLLLVWQLGNQAWSSYQSNDVAPTPLATPLWIPQTLMPLGAILLGAVLLGHCWRSLRILFARGAAA